MGKSAGFGWVVLSSLLVFGITGQPAVAREKPARAIIFLIDGMHWQAAERMGLKNLQSLAKQGTAVEKTYAIMPVHPGSGPWAEVHSCSIPNPVLAAGSVFLKPELPRVPYHKMVQNSFKVTAHITNAGSYRTMNPGFNFTMTAYGDDADAVKTSLELLKRVDLQFMLIHLQEPGNAGGAVAFGDQKDAPWHRNIWGEGSPYVAKTRRADRLLGEFVQGLKAMGKWKDTLLVVTADHGQAKKGWHPPTDPESWLMPAVFVGPNVARGRKIPYADVIDIVPTICDFLGVEPPYQGPGAGRVLHEIKQRSAVKPKPHPQTIRRINEVLRRHQQLLDTPERSDYVRRGKLAGISRRAFTAEDILRWHEAGSVENLLETNRSVIKEMEAVLRD